MKSIILTCSIFLFYITANAQLKVEAGKDTTICFGYNYNGTLNYTLGGNPTASGGVEPYKYTWSGKWKYFPSSANTHYASELLDDTTLSNPSFKVSINPEDWLTFHLKVEDAVNNIQYDSVKIRTSNFIYSLLGIWQVVINLGDSILLPGNLHIDGRYWPFTFSISPSYGLSDTTDIFGWAKPDISTLYYLTAVNSIGCVSKKVAYFYVEVDSATLSNDIHFSPIIQCYLDQGDLVINRPEENNSSYYIVTIAKINGVIIHTGKYSDRNLRISNLNLIKNQLYIVSINDGNLSMVYKLLNNQEIY